MIKRLIAFLLICALALLIGGLFTGPGVESAWYQNANQAPWTPPGWVFGVAWTVIMLFYALYWSLLWPTKENKVNLSLIFGLQIVLNIIWNPIFFYWHLTELALFVL
ncbi:MAG: TspO/MBR family protein, partial [Flavobacteriales bacterium]